jgi:hypothetical protein
MSSDFDQLFGAEADTFAGDQDEFFGTSLDEVQYRKDLERRSSETAAVILDLIDKGPLHKYVTARRGMAIEAIVRLVDAPPGDVQKIAEAQADVREYLRATEWIHGEIEAAKDATEQIEKEYGNDEEEFNPDED